MTNLFRSPISFVKNKEINETYRIAVVSASRCAGGSFFCSQKALSVGEKAHIVELGESSYYLAYDMEKRFAGKGLFFVEDALKSAKTEDSFASMFGMSYLVRNPKNKFDLTKEDIFKLAALSVNGHVFYDFSGVDNDIVLSVLSEMDEVYMVIDPLPSKLLKAAPFIEQVKLIYPRAYLVVNKMNNGVHKTELRRFLGENILEVPMYPAEKIYSAEYNCSIADFGLK